MKKKILFSMFLFFLFLLNFNMVYSKEVKLTLTEHSGFEKLLSGSYLLLADGTLKIYNPSKESKIYEFNIPLELDSLIGISKVVIDNSSNKFNFNFERIKGYIIEPGETVSVGYHIFGILDYNVYEKSVYQNKSIFEYYTDGFKLSSNINLNIEKPQREGYYYNNDVLHSVNKNLSPNSTTNTSRIISVIVHNPTDFSCFVKTLNLFKTKVSDPYFENGEIISTKNNLSILPFSSYKYDFTDPFSNDYSVYWLSSNVYLNYELSKNYSYHYFEEQEPLPPKPISPDHTNYTNYSQIIVPDAKLNNSLDSVLIKKTVNKALVVNGENIKVILQIVNVNAVEINNLTIFDEVPKGYDIINISVPVELNNKVDLKFKIDKIDKYETKIIEYTLVNKNKLRGITYLKPAKLLLNNKSYFSSGVLVVNDLIGNKKIFVEKEIKVYDDTYSKVIIKVKNLGNVKLEDLLVVDQISNNSIIKEISKVFFQRGSWKIKELPPGGEWEVSYLIEKNSKIDSIPQIFGVEKSQVFGTLVSSDEIITTYHEQPKTFEKIGMGLAVGLLIFYLLF